MASIELRRREPCAGALSSTPTRVIFVRSADGDRVCSNTSKERQGVWNPSSAEASSRHAQSCVVHSCQQDMARRASPQVKRPSVDVVSTPSTAFSASFAASDSLRSIAVYYSLGEAPSDERREPDSLVGNTGSRPCVTQYLWCRRERSRSSQYRRPRLIFAQTDFQVLALPVLVHRTKVTRPHDGGDHERGYWCSDIIR